MRIPLTRFNEYDSLLKRIDELSDQSERYQLPRYSNFLRPNEYQTVNMYLKNRCLYEISGGYPNATLRRVIFNDPSNNKIVCLYCHIKDKYVKLTHRDVLGALMNLGIKRDQFGDMWVDNGVIVIYVMEENHRYIIDHLTKINKLNVSFSISLQPIIPNINIREFTKVVSGLRLDCIVAALVNISRSKAQDLIVSGLVSVNYEMLEEKDFLCNNDDTISIRGYGRYIIMEVLKNTKKERLLLRLGQYE